MANHAEEMEVKNEMNKGAKGSGKIGFFLSLAILLAGILLLVPAVQNLIIAFGEKCIVHRALTHSVWISRFNDAGVSLLIYVPLPFILLIIHRMSDFERKNEKEKFLFNDKTAMLTRGNLWTLLVFLSIFFVLCFHLTHSPLGFDEGVEYWFSKVMFGKIYDFNVSGGASNMYQRIRRTFQPPLYNVLMFFWLKVWDSEFSFRLFNVIAVFIGIIGFYKTLRLFLRKKIALLFSFWLSTCWTVVYYAQECAEYSLLLCFSFWLCFYWIKTLQEFSVKNFYLYLLFSVLAVYSQYGAAFVVAGSALSIVVSILIKKDSEFKKRLIFCAASFVAMFLIFVLPLIKFFLIKQIAHSGIVNHMPESFYGNALVDFFYTWSDSVKYFFFASYPDRAHTVRTVVLILTTVALYIVAKKDKNGIVVRGGGGILLAFVMYYSAVHFKIYAASYTSAYRYGNRWALAFLPPFACFYIYLCWSFYKTLKEKSVHKLLTATLHKAFYVLILLLSFYNVYRVWRNWEKTNIREVYYEWKNHVSLETVTLLENRHVPSFMFYLYHDKDQNFDNQIKNRIEFIDGNSVYTFLTNIDTTLNQNSQFKSSGKIIYIAVEEDVAFNKLDKIKTYFGTKYYQLVYENFEIGGENAKMLIFEKDATSDITP